MLSFELAGGASAVRRLFENLAVFTLAESLGGIESLVAHPVTMTHLGMGAEARRVAGITDGLVRLSIGLEAEDDLIADLKDALDAAQALRVGRSDSPVLEPSGFWPAAHQPWVPGWTQTKVSLMYSTPSP